MSQTKIHVINHTHWDREWFLTSVYTSRWVPGLMDKLSQLAAANPAFRFLFDGQTLVIEDLLTVAPDYADRVKALIASEQLTVGPYYCQPDWQLTSGELLIRNLQLGQEDLAKLGTQPMRTGWLVDTFGHVSQSPQIHRMFGIDTVYVWRGVPQLTPYFNWQGADGSHLLTIDLFGGYRNLYGITHAPEVAVKRLHAEVEKLLPYYPTPDMPLFDGYDLEDNPEDPLRFYAGQEIGSDLALVESTPARFAAHLAAMQLDLPTIRGELNSGKYGATFPGTFSARTYLKIMARDCEALLLQRCEPLAVMAHAKGRPYPAAQFEAWSRALLQNAVHDCICGVSIDQVHEKMEYSYHQTFDSMAADTQDSLATILADFAPGTYAVSTTPFAVDQWQPAGDELIHVRTDGVGVWPVAERLPIQRKSEEVTTFIWKNQHFSAQVNGDGTVSIGDGTLGRLVISAEHGDTYSDEPGQRLGVMDAEGPLVVEARSEHHAVVRFSGAWTGENASATATVRLTFDPSPVVTWQIDLDSRGTDLRVDMVFATAKTGRILAGMPFDVVERAAVDTDLLPKEVSPTLGKVLLGQREVDMVSTFPFHDFVAMSDNAGSVAVLAKGIRSYDADGAGTLRLHLRRAVEWLTAADLPHRIGDAGPFFYVPDARCERTVRHEIGVAVVPDVADSVAMQALNAAFQTPPLIVQGEGAGVKTNWPILRADLPLASLHLRGETVLARLYNPTPDLVPLSSPMAKTDVWGSTNGEIDGVAAKAVVTVQMGLDSQPASTPAAATLLTPFAWRVGENQGLPDPIIVDKLAEKMAVIDTELAEVETKLTIPADDATRLRLLHRTYVLGRERLESQLSVVLNRRKLAQNGALGHDYLYEPDAEIAEAGLNLNRLRIKRRIFDYVVAALD